MGKMEKISILWDLDGTIVDSVVVYYEAYRGVYEKYHLGPLNETPEGYRKRYFGSTPEYFFRNHIKEEIPEDQMRAMTDDYLRFANEYLISSADGGVRLLPDVGRVIDAFYQKGYPMAIASTSWLPNVIRALDRVSLLEKFANIASGYLLPSKPAPDVFRLAAALNHVPPERCVVFEDSLAGMKGAKNAGMKCVGIASSVPVKDMCDADIRLEHYDDLSIEAVEALFADAG